MVEMVVKVKGVGVRVEGKDEVIVRLNKCGIGGVSGGDMREEGDVEMVKGEEVMWEVRDEKGCIRMGMKVEGGGGYVGGCRGIDWEEDEGGMGGVVVEGW